MTDSMRLMLAATYQETVSEALTDGEPCRQAHDRGVQAAVAFLSAKSGRAAPVGSPPGAGSVERRWVSRHPGTGLIAVFGRSVVEVVDISLVGIRLAHRGDLGRGEIAFQLAKRGGQGARAPATAMAVAKDRDLHLQFVSMNYRLAQLIVEHVAAVSGIQPYIFR